jgi:hypothetical protein
MQFFVLLNSQKETDKRDMVLYCMYSMLFNDAKEILRNYKVYTCHQKLKKLEQYAKHEK